MTTGVGSHHSHAMETDDWLTPPHIIKALGPFDLDPCASIDQPWPTASKMLTKDDDGLAADWEGFVWCNPPYGQAAYAWAGKLADHGRGILLVFARVETQGFVTQCWNRAHSMLFLHQRLIFHYPVTGAKASANGGAPNVLVAYGARATARLMASGLEGSLVTKWRNQ